MILERGILKSIWKRREKGGLIGDDERSSKSTLGFLYHPSLGYRCSGLFTASVTGRINHVDKELSG